MKSRYHLAAVFFCVLFGSIQTWESFEPDLFDLVEELGTNNNFYQYIGLEQSAELADIKKAYRKLSLQWHPDKSDDPSAEQKFRHLVAIYEVLKDEKRRARYNRILVEGLPRWNQPLYYYRRARKLRIWEILTILSAITTIGHYIVLWAMYFESSLTMNEKSMDVRKRLEKRLKKSNKMKDIDQNLIEEEMARITPVLVSPHFTDILPIRFANTLVYHRFFIPHLKHLIKHLLSSRHRKPSVVLVSSSDDDIPSKIKSPTVRIDDIVPEMASTRTAPEVSYLNTPLSSLDSFQSEDSLDANRPWSEEEKQLLCKTIIRFPPGAPRRWEKIAEVVGRSVAQVTDMAKQIQKTVGSGGAQQNDLSFTPTTILSENLITERDQSDAVMIEWSQTDQHLLECALKTVPKDVPPGVDRWEQIARCIPGKTRDECLSRYRYIVHRVKAKKMA